MTKTKIAEQVISPLFAKCVLRITAKHADTLAEADKSLNSRLLECPAALAECEKVRDLKLSQFETANNEYGKLNDNKIIQYASGVDCYNRIEVTLDLDDLRNMRQAYGPFTLVMDEKDVEDAEKGTVKIPVRFKEHEFTCFRFYTIQTLLPDAKCRIVKTTRVVEDTSIVCDMPNVDDIPDDE